MLWNNVNKDILRIMIPMVVFVTVSENFVLLFDRVLRMLMFLNEGE
jgi:hypothetical protein